MSELSVAANDCILGANVQVVAHGNDHRAHKSCAACVFSRFRTGWVGSCVVKNASTDAALLRGGGGTSSAKQTVALSLVLLKSEIFNSHGRFDSRVCCNRNVDRFLTGSGFFHLRDNSNKKVTSTPSAAKSATLTLCSHTPHTHTACFPTPGTGL